MSLLHFVILFGEETSLARNVDGSDFFTPDAVLARKNALVPCLLPSISCTSTGEEMRLASEAVQMRKSLKVIYATGETPTDGMKALFVSGSLFLGKPYVPDDLLRAVDELTSGGHGMPSG